MKILTSKMDSSLNPVYMQIAAFAVLPSAQKRNTSLNAASRIQRMSSCGDVIDGPDVAFGENIKSRPIY